MNETQTPQENEAIPQATAAGTEANNGAGLSVIQSANEAAERAEKATAELKAIKQQMDEQYAAGRMGGVTTAGQVNPQQTEEEKKLQGASEYFKGTSLGEVIKRANE